MRFRLNACAAGLLLLAASQAAAAGRAATVYTVDDQKLVATVMDDSFAMRTAAGVVTVPASDVRAIYPGFPASDAVRKRIDLLIPLLKTPRKDAAARDLGAIGRAAVPALQAAASGQEAEIAKEAAGVLKTLWPSNAKVPSDTRDILLTKSMEFRGMLEFNAVRLEGTFGKKTLPASSIRMVQFEEGEPAPAADPVDYGTLKGKTPEVELETADGTRIVGALDVSSLDVDTPYGKLTVALKDLVSLKPGETDEVVTRDLTFQGKLAAASFSVHGKLGEFKLDRDKVKMLKVVRNEPGTGGTLPPGFKLNQWTTIFDGKDLKGWRAWDGQPRKIENGILHLSGDMGMGYAMPGDLTDLFISVRGRITALHGSGLEIALRGSKAGSYYVMIGGQKGVFGRWDTKDAKGVVLKEFETDVPVGEWHTIQFGIVGTVMGACVDGKPVAEVAVDPKELLPRGTFSFAVSGCDADFSEVQIKVLK